MSKWDKPAKPVTQQFLQNQQRRRQMIIEASKMRRQKLRKLEQLNQNIKKEQEQAMQKVKKQKQEANKYMKGNNMHDKYEQIKRNQKMQIQEQGKKQVSKWKKRDNSQNKVVEGLEQDKNNVKSEVSINKNVSVEKVEVKKGMETKKAVEQEFEKQWGDEKSIEEDLVGSKLLDSLDLDIDTMQRGRQLNNKIEKVKKLNNGKPNIDVNQVEQIKNLIGYDSMLLSKLQQPSIKPSINVNKSSNKSKPKQQAENKEVNQQETFINLKHKKQGKLLNWANDKVEQADDLFSNCSSNKNLTKLNNLKENKGSKKMLEPIRERSSQNKSIEKDKKSVQKPPQVLSTQAQRKGNMPPKINSNKSMERFENQPQNLIQNRKQTKISEQKRKVPQQQKRSEKIIRNTPFGNQNQNRNRSQSKDKVKQVQQAAFQKQRQKSLEKIRERRFSNQRTTSAQKPRNPQPQPLQQIPKTQQPFRMAKSPPIPAIPKPTYTIATHEQYFDVESFIKNDLLHLNQQQTKLQQQIRNIHLTNKQKVKQIQAKHQIRTNYKTSANLIKKLNNQFVPGQETSVNTYANIYNMNEDMIEDSIQRLDDLLIKKQIKQKQKTQISQQSNIKSIINPFSKPEQLHKQILQLAENISKFQNPPNQEIKGYGYQRKIKSKQPKKQQIPEQISVSRNIDDVNLNNIKAQAEAKKNSLKMPTPPMLQYSSKNSELVEIELDKEYYDPEDSLESMKKQKIQVNEKLRNILFD